MLHRSNIAWGHGTVGIKEADFVGRGVIRQVRKLGVGGGVLVGQGLLSYWHWRRIVEVTLLPILLQCLCVCPYPGVCVSATYV